MAKEDIAKTTFRCPGAISLFEWVVITFGLKNVGVTYQRAMNYIFHKLIGRIVKIYIDDVMIKSKGYKEHLADLRETLECTRKHGLKNAGATYQRAMNYIFHKLIGRIIENYIDDMMIKSKGYKEHQANL